MKNSASNNNASGSNSMITLIAVLFIAAFVVVGAFAVVPVIKQHSEDKAMRNGEKEPTVAFMAREADKSTEEYLAQYGLTLGDAITENSVISEVLENMTIGNYNTYMAAYGNTIDISQFSDAVTEDTVYKDFMAMPAETVLGTEMYNATKEAYSMGDEITGDMSWEDFQNALYTYASQANAVNPAE